MEVFIRRFAAPLVCLVLLGGVQPLPTVRLQDGRLDKVTFREMLLDMPKTEIHTHLEGCVRPETILELAEQYKVELPATTVEEFKKHIQMQPAETLLDFLKKFDSFRFVFDHPESLRRIAYEMIEENALENVLYTEIRINPIKRPDKLSLEGVLDAVLDGLQDARRDLDVEASLIVSINRSYPVESAMQIAHAAVERKSRGVVGLDLGGDEEHFPVANFKAVFDYALANGLHITIHAGEAMGPESIRQAIEVCHAERIGHGVRLRENLEILQEVKQRGVLLEMCPNSNLLINVVKDLPSYPLANYYHQGIPVTINTDDRHIFDLTLTGEYMALAENNNLTLQELENISLCGARSSFLPPLRKAALVETMQERMQQFEDRWRSRLTQTQTEPQR